MRPMNLNEFRAYHLPSPLDPLLDVSLPTLLRMHNDNLQRVFRKPAVCRRLDFEMDTDTDDHRPRHSRISDYEVTLLLQEADNFLNI